MTDRDDRGRMREVSHTHPDHDTRDWHYFRRGPAIAADGGQRDGDAADEAMDEESRREQMRDVSHTPPHGDGADRVWDGTRVYERGRDSRAGDRDDE